MTRLGERLVERFAGRLSALAGRIRSRVLAQLEGRMLALVDLAGRLPEGAHQEAEDRLVSSWWFIWRQILLNVADGLDQAAEALHRRTWL